MNLLRDVITYIRRLIKSPSNSEITDSLIVDYINRFWTQDVDARMQLFDLKTKYQFQTSPGVDQYNTPLYALQSSLPINGDILQETISYYPVYQGFFGPAYINGVQIRFETQKDIFYNSFPKVTQSPIQVAIGDGTAGPYNLTIPIIGPPPSPLNPPVNALIRGHVDLTGVISYANNSNIQDPPLVSQSQINDVGINNNGQFIQRVPVTSVDSSVFFTSIASDGSSVVVQDSGQFLQDNVNYGLLMSKGQAPNGNTPLTGGTAPFYSSSKNTINYLTGVAENVYFPKPIPAGAAINAQCYYFNSGLPRSALYYNNVITLRSPPDRQYLVELDAYLTPAAFLSTGQAIQFAYMSEYLARGAARKILSDTMDVEQFNFYEPLFKEQELLVWKRSQRQFTATRTQTIYSMGHNNSQGAYGSCGGNAL